MNSGSLLATGADAISDAVISFSTFVAAIISIFFKVSLEGYIGIIISLIILKSAYDILKDTINDMIGVRADGQLVSNLKDKIQSYEQVLGVYDLILHNYGPNNIIATVNIQVKDEKTAKEIHILTKKIATDIYNEYGIIITIGIYASNEEKKYDKIKLYINEIIKNYKNILQTHGFYVDEKSKNISIDIIISFDEKNPESIIEEIKNKLKEKFPNYNYVIVLDRDFSD